MSILGKSVSTEYSNTIRCEFQGGLVAFACNNADRKPPMTTAKRGKVDHFSRKSRHRLMRQFARLDYNGHKWCFITLTYPQTWPNPREAKADLRAFIKRLQRLFHAPANKFAIIWRLEFQQRGAPHFHLMVMDLPFVDKLLIQWLWNDIHKRGQSFTRIEMIYARKKAMSYVSKYVAKCGDDADGFGFGGFNYIPYSSTECGDFEEEQSIGRFWGMENRELLPYAEKVEFVVFSLNNELSDMKRYAAKKWRRVPRVAGRGFSLFVEDATVWLKLWRHTLKERAKTEFGYNPVCYGEASRRLALLGLGA